MRGFPFRVWLLRTASVARFVREAWYPQIHAKNEPDFDWAYEAPS
jgi:hypothetical protein